VAKGVATGHARGDAEERGPFSSNGPEASFGEINENGEINEKGEIDEATGSSRPKKGRGYCRSVRPIQI
jgi:hypothetical protein